MSRPLAVAILLSWMAGAALSQDSPFQMPRADDSGPVQAPPAAAPQSPPSDGIEGILNDLLGRAQPHLEGLARDLGGVMDDYAPMLDQLGGLMDDIGNYQLPPERLANGDILIRRKAGAPPPPALDQIPGLMPRPDVPGATSVPDPQPGTDL